MNAVVRPRSVPRPAPFALAVLVLWSLLGIAVGFGFATQWR